MPPRLIHDFDIPDRMIVAKIKVARMVSPQGRAVDIAIEGGYVGMIDREDFDEFLRDRAAMAGAERLTGTFLRVKRDGGTTRVIWRDKATGEERTTETRASIGADGARSHVPRCRGGRDIPYVIAYHEIIEAPAAGT